MAGLSIMDDSLPQPTALRALHGAGLAAMTVPAKRRLLALSLGQPRIRRIARRADASALISYLIMTLPLRRAVVVGPEFTLGIATPNGRSLAYIARRSLEQQSVTSLAAFGNRDAERQLIQAVQRWVELGAPDLERLEISVTYEQVAPSIRWRHLKI